MFLHIRGQGKENHQLPYVSKVTEQSVGKL